MRDQIKTQTIDDINQYFEDAEYDSESIIDDILFEAFGPNDQISYSNVLK